MKKPSKYIRRVSNSSALTQLLSSSFPLLYNILDLCFWLLVFNRVECIKNGVHVLKSWLIRGRLFEDKEKTKEAEEVGKGAPGSVSAAKAHTKDAVSPSDPFGSNVVRGNLRRSIKNTKSRPQLQINLQNNRQVVLLTTMRPGPDRTLF